MTLKSAEPHLWEFAKAPPYKESKFSTTVREFTPSYAKRQAAEFVPTELKQLVLPPRIKLG